jgi:magnesium-transporting ATPase (P-type)
MPFSISSKDLCDVVDFDKRADLARQKGLIEAKGGVAGLLGSLNTSVEKGIIGKADIEERIATYGVNKSPPPKTVTFGELVWDAFQDQVLQILLVGAVITLIVGMITDPSTGWHEGISIVLTVGIVVGCKCGNDYWKEKKFQQILARAALKKCKVRRSAPRPP